MRKSVLAVVLTLLFIPVTAPAQSTSGIGGCPGLCAPCGLTGYVGWVESRVGRIDSQHWHQQGFNYQDRTAFRGPWVGVALDTRATENLGLIITGGMLLGPHNRGTLDEVTGPVLTDHNIKSRGEWWSHLEGIGAYAMKPCDPFRFLLGFRWEHYDNAFNLSNRPPGNPSSGEYHIKTNRYIPLVGADYRQMMETGGVNVRVTASPLIFGHTKYGLSEEEHVLPPNYMSEADSGDISNGQFLELFMEYRKAVAGLGNLGLFAKWNYLKTQIDNIDAEVALLFGGVVPATITDTVDVTFRQDYWTLGGSFTVDFNLL